MVTSSHLHISSSAWVAMTLGVSYGIVHFWTNPGDLEDSEKNVLGKLHRQPFPRTLSKKTGFFEVWEVPQRVLRSLKWWSFNTGENLDEVPWFRHTLSKWGKLRRSSSVPPVGGASLGHFSLKDEDFRWCGISAPADAMETPRWTPKNASCKSRVSEPILAGSILSFLDAYASRSQFHPGVCGFGNLDIFWWNYWPPKFGQDHPSFSLVSDRHDPRNMGLRAVGRIRDVGHLGTSPSEIWMTSLNPVNSRRFYGWSQFIIFIELGLSPNHMRSWLFSSEHIRSIILFVIPFYAIISHMSNFSLDHWNPLTYVYTYIYIHIRTYLYIYIYTYIHSYYIPF